tara:strand:- start:13066 stop:13386 length:321 start_codon:yes stop_codon:yes gene_type:complete
MKSLKDFKNISVLNKKGQLGGGVSVLQSLLAIGLTFVVISIALGFGAKVNSDVSADLDANSTAKAAVDNGTEAIGNLSKYLPTLATVAAAAAIIVFLLAAFSFARR